MVNLFVTVLGMGKSMMKALAGSLPTEGYTLHSNRQLAVPLVRNTVSLSGRSSRRNEKGHSL